MDRGGGEQAALFPMFSLSPTTRQTTRALQEIQAQRPGLLVVEEEGLSVAHIPTQPTDITDRVSWTVNLSDALDTPSPSPDEMAIQARGRRKVPLTFSPDLTTSPLASARQRELSTTPLARHPGRSHLSSLSQASHARLLLPAQHTRTSPRKRLLLNDSPPSSSSKYTTSTPSRHSPTFSTTTRQSPPKPGSSSRPSPATPVSSKSTSNYSPPRPCSPSPDKPGPEHSPLAKRIRLERGHQVTSADLAGELVTAARGLSQNQLVQLLSTVINRHPQLTNEVATLMPSPDLGAMEENLNYLKKNIYKALPSTRLESKIDSMAYNRVSVHLVAFKKGLVESLRTLLDSHHWIPAIDYTVVAWAMVKATPLWSNPSHNTVRRTCFKQLATGCMRALREASFSSEQCVQVRSRLERLKSEGDEILVCLKYLDFIINRDNLQ